jgi:hypothetical protein
MAGYPNDQDSEAAADEQDAEGLAFLDRPTICRWPAVPPKPPLATRLLDWLRRLVRLP